MKRNAEREPDYVTSLILQHPIEMIQARKVAYLVLLQRGWIVKFNYFEAPDRISTWRTARERNNGASRRRSHISCWAPAQALAHWKRLGIVKSVEVTECRMGRRVILTPKGEQLLGRIAPEVMAEARALVRAAIWGLVLERRRVERRKALVAAMAALPSDCRLPTADCPAPGTGAP